ncbi:YdcF family protein [Candidatus Woesearchaeota archaeon]|nr:YdcF family protein [Candidatus Woesearchaeota archaeon]
MSSFKNVMIVLGNKPKKDGRPSDQMVSRVRRAISLYRKNNYSKVILSGGQTRLPIPESEMMRIMILHYIPENRLVLERRSKDTIQNAVFCWELLKDKKPKQITIVTNDTHMIKSRHIFTKTMKNLGARLIFESVPDTYDPIERVFFRAKERLVLLKLKLFGIR